MEDAKFPICVLKVNIGCCKSCPEAVTKLLLATQGVKAVKTEADKCLVTVTGTTPPQKLIKQIAKIKRKAIVASYTDPTKEEAKKNKDSGKEEEEKDSAKEEHHHHHHHHSFGHKCGNNVVPPQQQQQEDKPHPCPEHTTPIFRVPPATAAHPEPPFPQRTQFTRDMHHYPPQQEDYHQNCRDPHCRHHHQNNPNPYPDHTTPIFRVPPQPHPKPPFPQRTQFTKDIQLPHSQFSPPLQPHLDPHYPPSRPGSNFSPPLQPYLDSHYPPSPPLQPYLDAHYPPSRQLPSGIHVPNSNLPPSWRPYNAMPPPHFNSHYPPQMRPPPNSYYNHYSGGDPYRTRPRPPPSYGGVGPRSRRPYYRDSDSDSDDEYTSFSGCNIL